MMFLVYVCMICHETCDDFMVVHVQLVIGWMWVWTLACAK